MPDFRLPDLGEGLDEAVIVAWHVATGDQVAVDQIVVEVETAKAAVEVPVPFAGTVAKLHAGPGDAVKVGEALITVDASETNSAGFREQGVVVPDRAVDAEEASGNVLIGYGTGTATATRRRRPRAAGRGDRAHVTASPRGPSPQPPATPHPAATPAVPVISPLVRRMARAAGLDLATITGTGPCGVIRREDIESAVRAREIAASARPAATEPDTQSGRERGETRIPLRGVRKAVADKLTRSRREIPEATVWVDVDATELLAARRLLSATGEPVNLLALLARLTVVALRRFPELNGRVDGDEIVVPDHVHLGFAAQTDRGLVVPVVHDAHRLSTRELAAVLARRTAAARAGELTPGELTGGTITVNNYGVFGVDGSAAIINHPEAAIIGLGRIIDRPWVVDGELTVRKVSQLTLAFDHRVCDGGTAGGFLRTLADYLENPVLALGDL